MFSFSDTIWANVVSWPWPWLWVPISTVTSPVAWTRTVALSKMPARAPSDWTIRDGARPQAST